MANDPRIRTNSHTLTQRVDTTAHAIQHTVNTVANKITTAEHAISTVVNDVNAIEGLLFGQPSTGPLSLGQSTGVNFNFYPYGATPYAMALASQHAPKTKFLFVVQFNFVDSSVASIFNNDEKMTAFLVKTALRPTVKFDYEDINLYNFRTKLLKKTEYDPMTLSFYDDGQNNVGRFYSKYISMTSPVSRISNASIYETNGMNFSDPANLSASTGPLINNTKTIFSNVNLYHIYDWGRRMTVYSFINPRIISLTPSELDMSSNEPSELHLQFNYDGLFVNDDVDVDSSITDLTNFGGLPIIPNIDSSFSTSSIPPSSTASDFPEPGSTGAPALTNTTMPGSGLATSPIRPQFPIIQSSTTNATPTLAGFVRSITNTTALGATSVRDVTATYGTLTHLF